MSTIPVRYPLSKMVGDGYAAIGDAAFMTIPMIGSGIANSLRAGKMLSDVVLSEKKADVKTLWRYQYKYFTKIGAGHCMVDKMKRMLLSSDSIGSGDKITLSPVQILDKVKKGKSHLPLLLKLVKAVSDGEKAEKHALSIPFYYDEKAVYKWQTKLDKMFNR